VVLLLVTMPVKVSFQDGVEYGEKMTPEYLKYFFLFSSASLKRRLALLIKFWSTFSDLPSAYIGDVEMFSGLSFSQKQKK